jgi:putative flippase GtrA
VPSWRLLVLRDLGLYGAASAAALALDWLVLTLLVRRGLPAAVAAAIGFSLGMLVTYTASIGVIFTDRRHGSRWRELTLFVVIGLAGLGLSVILILAFGALLGLSAPIAKAPTAGIVFLFNFATRRTLLFANRPEA